MSLVQFLMHSENTLFASLQGINLGVMAKGTV